MTTIPLIDITPLRSGTEAERATTAQAIGQACRETGFFYMQGHGVTPDRMEKMFAASRLFFSQSPEAKDTLAMRHLGKNRGYVGLGVERLDTSSLPDRKEAFNLNRDEAGTLSACPDLPGWRALMEEYFATCLDLGALLHPVIARDLGVA